jgi:hypothetical protein
MWQLKLPPAYEDALYLFPVWDYYRRSTYNLRKPNVARFFFSAISEKLVPITEKRIFTPLGCSDWLG